MKVNALIKKLKKMDENAEVRIVIEVKNNDCDIWSDLIEVTEWGDGDNSGACLKGEVDIEDISFT